MSKNNKNTDNTVECLLEVYGSKSFLKVYPVFNIGKIKFSFAEKGNESNGIDCWMNVDDFISDLINKIRTEKLEKKLIEERKRFVNLYKTPDERKGKYYNDVWKSRIGTTANKELRHFTIQPGLSTDLVFRAIQNGRIITVGSDYRELELLEYRWTTFLEKDFLVKLAEVYNVENMKNPYYENNPDVHTDEPTTYETPVEEPKATGTKPTETKPQAELQNNNSDRPEPPKYSSDDNPAPNQPNPNQTTATSDVEARATTMQMKFKSTVPIADYAHGKCLKAVTEENEEYIVLFPNESIAAISNWKDFENNAKNVGMVITCVGAFQNDKFYVKSLAS